MIFKLLVNNSIQLQLTIPIRFFLLYRAGGVWHITDMRRGESIFELEPNAHEEVERGFELEGSNLSGVSARCSWADQDFSNSCLMKEKRDDGNNISEEENEQMKSAFQKSIYSNNNDRLASTSSYKNDDGKENSTMLESTELLHVKKLEGVHLVFNLEAGSLLPLAIR